MKKLLSNKIIHKSFVLIVCITLFVGCSSGSCIVNPTFSGSAITIDNSGLIPVFGDNSTSTIVYVHNNTKQTISGISYSLSRNASNNNQCSSIAAGKSCGLSLKTPVLENLNTQGSIAIKASYSLNGQAQTFNQIINYAKVSDNLNPSGVEFTSGVEVSGYGNPTGYATVYLYGSGQSQTYNVSDIAINNANITIINGDISGQQIQSNVVQAIEVSSPITSSLLSAAITANSNTLNSANRDNDSVNNSTSQNVIADQFSSSVDLVVEPVTAGAILNAGLVPLINTVNGTNASLSIQNSGNKPAILGKVSAENGISNLSGCSGQTLSPGAICTISFNVTESSGSSNINIPYSGGSANIITANVTWFHGANSALVSISANNNPVTFFAAKGESTTVTVTNIGGYALTNISIPNPAVIGGSATVSVVNDNCSNTTLAINASCQYDVNVNDNVTDLNKQIQLGFNASYAVQGGSRDYNQVMILAYNSIAIPQYIYITNTGSNPSTISMYSINSGVLVPFGPESTVAAQKFSSPIRFTPSGTNAYVVNSLGRNLSMFSVGSNGLFTPLSPESTVATQLSPGGVVINQAGTYAYVNNRSSASNSISIYTINNGGLLTPISPVSTAPTQAGPLQVAFNKSGKYAYVVNQTSRTISMYHVDSASGMLIPFLPESTVNTQNTPSLLTFNAAETYAYLTNLNSNTISMYSVNNGVLIPLSPESTVATGSAPSSFVLDSSNKHAYVVNGNGQSISMYNIINGVLVPMSPDSTVITQNTPNNITLDQSGKHAYVINQISSTISMYNINNSGVLTPMYPESTVPTQINPGGPMLIDPSNSFAYVANLSSSTISMYRILNGVLIPLSPESTVQTQTAPTGLIFGPY